MKKTITSKDPRKSFILDLLKSKSGGSKVTKLMEDNESYIGDCLAYEYGKYTRLGTVSVKKVAVIEKLISGKAG